MTKQDDLSLLSPDVRDALDVFAGEAVCTCHEAYVSRGMKDPQCSHDLAGWVETLRSELLRLTKENAELRMVCAATYQAAGCYGLPDRFKDVLSNAMTGEHLHDIDMDTLLPVEPVDWVERAERAEAELAKLQARIADAPVVEVALFGDPFIVLPAHLYPPEEMKGKRVRLVVEDGE